MRIRGLPKINLTGARGNSVAHISGGPYNPRGINLDGATWLQNDALATTDGDSYSFSLLTRHPADILNSYEEIWVSDPVHQYDNYLDYFVSGDGFTPALQFAGGINSGTDQTSFAGPTLDWHSIIGTVFMGGNAEALLKFWSSIACSADGTYIAAMSTAQDGGANELWMSSDGGATFVEGGPTDGQYNQVSMTPDGSHYFLATYNGHIWHSTDHGANWTAGTSANVDPHWVGVCSSSDGTKVFTAEANGKVWKSVNSGATFTELAATPVDGHVIQSICCDETGQYVLYCTSDFPSGGGIFVSADGGTTWTTVSITSRRYFGVAMADDASVMYAIAYDDGGTGGGSVFKSTDHGITWTNFGSGTNIDGGHKRVLGCSADGTKIAVGQENGTTAISVNGGTTFSYPTPFDMSLSAFAFYSGGLLMAGYIATAQGAFRSTDFATVKPLIKNDPPYNIIRLLVDGVPMVGVIDNAVVNSPTTMLFNGLPFLFGNDTFGSPATGDYADFWFDMQSLLKSDHVSWDYDKVQKFLKRGLPQNPSGFPAGAVLLSASGSDPASFGDNKGTGGAFTRQQQIQSTSNLGTSFVLASDVPAGTTILSVSANDPGNDVSNLFETTISVAGHVQQIDNSTDLDGHLLYVICIGLPLTFADYDPNDVVMSIVFRTVVGSNGLTVTNEPLIGTFNLAQANVHRSTGKLFFSVHIDSTEIGNNDIVIGLASSKHYDISDGTARNWLGGDDGSIGWYSADPHLYYNESQIGAMPLYDEGDDVDLRVDLDAKTVAGRVNGGAWSDDIDISALLLTGPVVPTIELDYGAATSTVTFNFGKTPYAHPAPAGFSNWTKGAPDWLPQGALAMADFKNGRYYDGVQECSAADMFVQDLNYGRFDVTADITLGVGLITTTESGGSNPTFKGNALSIVTDGSTMVIDAGLPGEGYCGVDVWDDPGYLADYGFFFRASTDTDNPSILYAFRNPDYINQQSFPEFTFGDHKITFTAIRSKLAVSRDGETVVSVAVDPTEFATPWDAATLNSSMNNFVRSITIYPPQLDSALPALSAL